MPLRKSDQQRFPLPNDRGNSFRQFLRRCTNEGPIYLVCPQSRQLRGRWQVSEMDLTLGMKFSKRLENFDQILIQQCSYEGQAKAQNLAGYGAAGRGCGGVEPRENLSCILKVKSAGGSQRD